MRRFMAVGFAAVLAGISLPLDAAAQFKYEHKYGPGQYNYDVSGYGSLGYIYGNVDTDGKDVEGYLYDENGDARYFRGEWSGYGVIEGYDEEGNWIELEAD